MSARDAVVTGVGMVTSLGIGLAPTWAGLMEGRTGCVPLSSDEGRLVGCAAQAVVPGFRGKDFVSNRKSLKLMSHQVQLGMAAAALAMEHGGLKAEGLDPEMFGVFVGAGQAFADSSELEGALAASRGADGGFDVARFGEAGLPLIHPLWLLRGLSNNVLGFVSLEYNAQGINNNYCNAGVSSAQALLSAARAIEEGLADVVLAGGYDAVTTPEGVLGYGLLGHLAQGSAAPAAQAHRPFDAGRTGLVPAEGACFLVLESREPAARRGARALARVLGGGVATDGYHITEHDPEGGGLRRALQAALSDVNASSDAVAAVFAHGEASPRLDPVEARVWREALGARASEVPVCAEKASLGHTVAASAAIAAGLAVQALDAGRLPPVPTLEAVDPSCSGLRYVVGEPAALPPGLILTASVGLGGQAAVLVLGPADVE